MTDNQPAGGKPAAGSQVGLRRALLAANWKMHKTNAEAQSYVQAYLPAHTRTDVDVVLCPPFTALRTVVEATRDVPVGVAAQNMHYERHGAFTGEVAAGMLTELGVDGVVLGHSERRAYFNETDLALQRKVPVALEAGLEPILCVGETEDERDADETERKLRHQISVGLAAVSSERLHDVVIAYEPIWAIGTGNTASPEQAQDAIAFVRALLADRDAGAAARMRILYGGSVNASNAGELLGLPDIDGALVGGASLDPQEFAAITAAAPVRAG